MNRLMVPLAALCAAAPLAAQARPDTLRPVLLEPVTVTVLRTPVELLRAPFAVSVNTGAEIQRAKPGLSVDEALRAIPGVQVDNRFNYALGERISIRGFGARSQFGVRGVRVLVDGIPATFPDGQTALSHVDPGLLGRVEVIRGPASALYGSSAGGIIQMETEQAPDRPLSQEVEVAGGSDGLLRLRSTTAGRGARAEYLLGVSRLEYGGYRDFGSADNLQLNARLGFAAGANRFRLVAAAVDYDARNPGSLSEALLRADRTQAFANNVRQRTGERGEQAQLGATWWRDTPVGELEVTGYGVTRAVDSPIPIAVVDLERRVGGVRALLRSRADAAVRWAVGAEGDLQRDVRRNFRNLLGQRGDVTLDQRERVTGTALFAQATASPLPRATLLGGVRYDRFHFGVDDRLINARNPDDSGRRVMDAVSPSLGLAYEASEALSLYGNVASAFETPTTSELANRPSGAGGFNPDLEPQRTLSLEAGAKGRLGGRALYQLALYRARVRDALIPFEVPQAPGRQFFRNAGSAVHRGVEAGLTLIPLAGARVRASYTLTDARFADYAAADGNRVPGVAPHRAELVAGYQTIGGWFATAESRWSSRVPVNDANSAHSPAYTVLDLRGGLARARLGRLELEPWLAVTNVLDAEYNTSVVVNAFGGRFFEPGPGRAVQAGVSLRL